MLALTWVPRESLGISLARAAVLFVLGGFLFVCCYWALRPPKGQAVLARSGIIVSCAVVSLISGIALFLLRYLDPEGLAPYFVRLSPLLWYFLALGIQTSVVLILERFGFHPGALGPSKAVLRSGAIAFALLLVACLFVVITRIGLTPDSAYWGEPGVPLLGWQLALAILATLIVLVVGLRARTTARWDALLGLAVWAVALAVWFSVPLSVMRNSFYAPMSPPTNQPFPNSDAGYYDSMSESLLIGHPFQGQIPTRPLYIVLLTMLHLAVGEHYELITAGQTVILAFIPVVLYLLGKSLHSRAAGLMIALFAILREWTSLLVSSQTRVSNTRTLLVDLPTLLLMCLACLVAVRWLARRDRGTGLIAGAVFGLALLLRTQSILIVPLLCLLAVLAYGGRDRKWVAALAWFVGGLTITVLPWLLHNYLQSGHVTFDAPFQYQIIASQYQYTGNLDINNVDLQGKSLLGILWTFLLRDPKFVLGFVATHFLATQINGLLALPLIEPYSGLRAPLNLYWLGWNGLLGPSNVALVIGYLGIIAVGLGAAWRRLRWSGLTPLVFSLGYSLANGIGRFSGWRYDLPADWVAYFYFGIGVAEIIGMFALLFGADSQKIHRPDAKVAGPPRIQVQTVVVVMSCVVIGASPWIAQIISRPPSSDQTQAQLLSALVSSPAVQRLGLGGIEVRSFVASQQGILQEGRVLYPRFFSRNTGLASAHPWPAYAPREFPRLGFLLLNQTLHDAVLPVRDVAGPFPHGANAVLLGCQMADHIDVRLILFPDLDSAYLGAPLNEPCQ